MTQHKKMALCTRMADDSTSSCTAFSLIFKYNFNKELIHLIKDSHYIPSAKIQAIFGDLYFKEFYHFIYHKLAPSHNKEILLSELQHYRNHFIYHYTFPLRKELVPDTLYKKIKVKLSRTLKHYEMSVNKLKEIGMKSHPLSLDIETSLEQNLKTIVHAIHTGQDKKDPAETLHMHMFRHFASFCILEDCSINDLLPVFDRFMYVELSNANP